VAPFPEERSGGGEGKKKKGREGLGGRGQKWSPPKEGVKKRKRNAGGVDPRGKEKESCMGVGGKPSEVRGRFKGEGRRSLRGAKRVGGRGGGKCRERKKTKLSAR